MRKVERLTYIPALLLDPADMHVDHNMSRRVPIHEASYHDNHFAGKPELPTA